MRHAAPAAALLLALGLAAFASPAFGQVVPPDGQWRTITTKHFRVSYQEGLEAPARRAAAQAEIAYGKLAQHLHPPRGTIDIVVADNVDFSNGSTTVFPTNRVILYSLPPLDQPSLEFYNGWWEELETHELTHAFHLDRTAGWWAVAQKVFGRAPLFFPNAYEPSWITEGLAVYYESALTDAGRINGTITSMVVRSTAQRNELPYWDTWSLATTDFPYGNIAYDYGAEFLDYLAATRGPATLAAFVESASRRPIPWTYNGAAEAAFGISYAAAWHRWHDSLAVETKTLASPSTPMAGWHDLGTGEKSALRPRWDANGASLTYAANLGKSFTAAYGIDTTGARRALGRRNSQDTQVPLADGGVLFAQLEYDDPYHIRSDLYVQLGRDRRRLTVGARLAQPDARKDGAIVAVRYEPATTALVRVSADGRMITPLTSVAADTEWAEPRWSPDGTLIAATRWTRGAYADVVVLDTMGRLVRVFSHDRAFDASPSWSPDGKSVLFTSNRTGNQNVYVALLADSAPPRKLSASTTGLFYPSLSPDGRTLAAVRYDADGDHVGLAPFDTTGAAPAPLDTSFIAPPYPAAVSDSSASHAYSPFPGLWPHYWLPMIGVNSLDGFAFGAYTGGSDIIGRHTYYAQATFNTSHYQSAFDFGYAYAGLGQPILTVQGNQYWDVFPIAVADSLGPTTVGSLYRRTREFDLGVTVRRLRVYSTAFATISGGYQEKHYYSSPDTLLPLLPSYYSSNPRFWLLSAVVGYANAATPITGVSPEDGISTVLASTLKWHNGDTDLWSESIQGSFSAFVALGRGSFAHPVLRGRVAAGISDGTNPGLFDLGGVSGGGVLLLPGVTVGHQRFFPVRGFSPGVESGTRIVSGTAELVLPLAALHRGFGFFPLFLDRSSITLFADGGSAWYTNTMGGENANSIASVGAELSLFVGVPYDAAYTVRIGVAAPVVNHSGTAVPAATVYFTLGLGR